MGNRGRELALYCVVSIALFALLSALDAFELLYEFTREHEEYELDEIALVVPVLAVCLAVFSYLRLKDIAGYVQDLRQAKCELDTANDSLAAMARSKKELLTVACHELKIPLDVIVHALEEAGQAQRLTDKHKYMVLAQECAGDLHMLFDDMLQFAQLTRDHKDQAVVSFAVAETMDSVMRVGRAMGLGKALDFALEIDDDVPEYVAGNESWLRLVCLNIINNAVKFSDSGCVAVRCSFRNLDRCELIVSVGDTGRGMPTDKLDAIYEPYVQLTDDSGTVAEGQGLGLHVVKDLLDTVGGFITVTSKEKVGSVFTVYFPVQEENGVVAMREAS